MVWTDDIAGKREKTSKHREDTKKNKYETRKERTLNVSPIGFISRGG